MLDDRLSPPPFGLRDGPSLPTTELLSAYLAGAQTGSSPDAYIDGPVLMAHDHPLAVRPDVAMIVRDEVPAVAHPVHAALCRALEASGMRLVESQSVLAGAVALELTAPRGFEWDLWARDPDLAREVLVRRALGDVPSGLEVDTAHPPAEMDAVLDQIEREW